MTIHATEPQPLSVVRDYRNEPILRAFTGSFDVAETQAQALFDDALQWLWLCARLRADLMRTLNPPPLTHLAITPSMRLVDEMWHTMLLHTADYRRLCDTRLGGFVDHLPERVAGGSESGPQDKNVSPRPGTEAETEAQVEAQLQVQFDYVYEQLGPNTLRRWYVEYARRHTPEYVQKITIPLTNRAAQIS